MICYTHRMENPTLTLAFTKIDEHLFADEAELVRDLAAKATLPGQKQVESTNIATSLVEAIRAKGRAQGSLDAFLLEYSLSSEEGIVLMCLAEALLRIPDANTADKLIADKIAGANWQSHLGKSESWFVNASSWGLMLTGKFIDVSNNFSGDAPNILTRLVKRTGEPVLRNAMRQAMRIMGQQFVLGQTMRDALARSDHSAVRRYSFDMLGESAATAEDAEVYFESYKKALGALAKTTLHEDVFANDSLSVKVSALHPRYEEKQRDTSFPILSSV